MRVRTALALLLPLLLAACSGGSGSEVPDGFSVLEREAYTVAYPSDWEITADEPGRVGITGVQQVSDVFESVIVQTDDTWSGDFDAVVRALVDPFRLFTVDDWQQTADEDIEIAGARYARLVEGTYASPEAEGRIRTQFIIAIASDDAPLVFVDLSAPESIFDESTAAQIRESLSV